MSSPQLRVAGMAGMATNFMYNNTNLIVTAKPDNGGNMCVCVCVRVHKTTTLTVGVANRGQSELVGWCKQNTMQCVHTCQYQNNHITLAKMRGTGRMDHLWQRV